MRKPTDKTIQKVIGAMKSDKRRAWTKNMLSKQLGIDYNSIEVILDKLLEDKKVAYYYSGGKSGFYVWCDEG